MTKIEWTHPPHRKGETWNPVTGCTPVSEGCRNCYAAREAIRLAGHPNPKVSDPYEGTSEMRGKGEARRPVFTGKVNTLGRRLPQPFKWRSPRAVFVNSMSDLFHPDVPLHFIMDVWATMAATPRHVYLILTKRPKRANYLLDPWWEGNLREYHGLEDVRWPLSNVILGTSVESQSEMERVRWLAYTDAAHRFVSAEPLLGHLDFHRDLLGRIDWVVVGGESGPKARPCRLEWIQGVLLQCHAQGVPAFVKQVGARPMRGGDTLDLENRKGGDPEEWPRGVQVRQWPRIFTGEEAPHAMPRAE